MEGDHSTAGGHVLGEDWRSSLMKPLVATIGAFLPFPCSLTPHLYNILISDTLDSRTGSTYEYTTKYMYAWRINLFNGTFSFFLLYPTTFHSTLMIRFKILVVTIDTSFNDWILSLRSDA